MARIHEGLVRGPVAELVAGAGGVGLDVEYVQPRKVGNDHVYAVKFVCGETAMHDPLVQGLYRTDINIVNFARKTSIAFEWRVALSMPPFPPASIPVKVIRGPFRGLQIDCPQIRRRLSGTPFQQAPFIKGFVVITASSPNLQVVAIYTAVHGAFLGPLANSSPRKPRRGAAGRAPRGS